MTHGARESHALCESAKPGIIEIEPFLARKRHTSACGEIGMSVRIQQAITFARGRTRGILDDDPKSGPRHEGTENG